MARNSGESRERAEWAELVQLFRVLDGPPSSFSVSAFQRFSFLDCAPYSLLNAPNAILPPKVNSECPKTACRANLTFGARSWTSCANTMQPSHSGSFPLPLTFVRYAGRQYDERELVNLVDASLDFWLTAGRYAEEFEARFADRLGLEYALLVNSGSSANLVAFSSLTSPKLKDRQVKPGDEVVTVAAGFPTTVNPIIQNRAVPVFVDVELGTYVPALERIEAAIGPRTKAVMIAHTMGVPFAVREVRDLCDRHGLWLIEDNCDALGSLYEGRLTGTFGDLATFSFYPAHHITMGEGGAVVTGNEDLCGTSHAVFATGGETATVPVVKTIRGRRFSQQFGTLPYGYDHKYVYSHIGYNLKVTDMQAAIGVAQLEKIDSFVAARKRNHAAVEAGLRKYESCLVLHAAGPKADPSWFGYVLTVRPGGAVHAHRTG